MKIETKTLEVVANEGNHHFYDDKELICDLYLSIDKGNWPYFENISKLIDEEYRSYRCLGKTTRSKTKYYMNYVFVEKDIWLENEP